MYFLIAVFSWLSAKVIILENVLGFQPILKKILALIKANIPGQFGCALGLFVALICSLPGAIGSGVS